MTARELMPTKVVWALRPATVATSGELLGHRRPARSPSTRPVTIRRPSGYDPCPLYGTVGGAVLSGWDRLADHAAQARVLAVDGPQIAPWDELVCQLRHRLAERGLVAGTVDARNGRPRGKPSL